MSQNQLYAIISDIHGNYPALQRVVEDAHSVARGEGLALSFICLGDVVDFGPFPNECMDWIVRNKPQVVLLGNHDAEAIRPTLARPKRVGRSLWPITYWTRHALQAQYRPVIDGWPGFALGHNGLGQFMFFHGDPAGGDDRIEDCSSARRQFARLDQHRRHGIFGHTHYQTMFVKNRNSCHEYFAQPEDVAEDVHSLRVNHAGWHDFPDRPALINPGSVGQPRFHTAQRWNDPRASYLLLQQREHKLVFQWRRVEYDVAATVKALCQLTWPTAPTATGLGNDILKGDTPAGDARLADFLSSADLEDIEVEFVELIETLAENLLQRRGVDLCANG